MGETRYLGSTAIVKLKICIFWTRLGAKEYRIKHFPEDDGNSFFDVDPFHKLFFDAPFHSLLQQLLSFGLNILFVVKVLL